MTRYLMSPAERRMKEAEPISLLEYVGGKTPSDRFSEAAIRFLQQAPRVLAAMTATDSDARSQLDIYVQLLRLNMQDPLVDDLTLVGPTSQAWLGHWKKYLKRQGGRFFTGSVDKLEVAHGHMRPVYKPTKYYTAGPIPEDADDVFLALMKRANLPSIISSWRCPSKRLLEAFGPAPIAPPRSRAHSARSWTSMRGAAFTPRTERSSSAAARPKDGGGAGPVPAENNQRHSVFLPAGLSVWRRHLYFKPLPGR